jgi:hypothetical protein|nr:MAG TPA: hypothetical protein [Bacteriophage sp.]
MAKETIEQNQSKGTKTRYFRVRFHERESSTEMPNVVLGVNGEILVIQRNVEVIIPEPYLRVAQSAVIRYSYPEPGDKETKVKHFAQSRCACDVLGEATEEEFLKMKREGTEKFIRDQKKKIEEAE